MSFIGIKKIQFLEEKDATLKLSALKHVAECSEKVSAGIFITLFINFTLWPVIVAFALLILAIFATRKREKTLMEVEEVRLINEKMVELLNKEIEAKRQMNHFWMR
jgi:hypothetical protein